MTSGDTESERRHALVAGGGSGGHVFPGIALAAELERRGWVVSFAGRRGGLEERLAAERGLAFHGLEAAPLVGTSPATRLRNLATTLRASSAGRRLVSSAGVDVVVGMGGYVSVPAVVGGWWARRPILLFEPNASPGKANRWLARLAAEAAVAYESAARSLPCTVTVTGTPLRVDFLGQPSVPPRPPLILVLGGSQGARQLNQMVPPALAEIGATVRRFEVLHQCGPSHVEETEAAYRAAAPAMAGIEVRPFIDDMAAALGRAWLVISRAGAITLAEICAVGRPSILVPLALAGAHQAGNAAALVEAGAALRLDSEAASEDLAAALRTLLETPDELKRMSTAARDLGRADAAERLADRVVGLLEVA